MTDESAVADLAENASLDDLRRLAVGRSPRLRALFETWRALSERAPQMRSLSEPRFTYTEYLRSVETRTGPQERSFGLQQAFPWFGKLRLRGSIEERRAAVAWQWFLAGAVALDAEVRSAYSDFYFLGRSIDVTRKNLELLTRLESVARGKFAAGAENHPDLIRLQVEIGRIEDRLSSLRDQERPRRARLNALLNRPADAALPLPESLPPPNSTTALTLDEVRRLAEENNPGLVALRYEIDRANDALALAEKEYFPDFSLGVQMIATGDARGAGVSGSGDDPTMVSLSLELPIWYSKYRAAEREAKAHTRAAKERLGDASQRLVADLEQALFELRDAERRFDLYDGSLVRKAEEALASTETSFQADRSDFGDLIDAERVLLEFQLAREGASRDRLHAEAKLDRLLGRVTFEERSKAEGEG